MVTEYLKPVFFVKEKLLLLLQQFCGENGVQGANLRGRL